MNQQFKAAAGTITHKLSERDQLRVQNLAVRRDEALDELGASQNREFDGLMGQEYARLLREHNQARLVPGGVRLSQSETRMRDLEGLAIEAVQTRFAREQQVLARRYNGAIDLINQGRDPFQAFGAAANARLSVTFRNEVLRDTASRATEVDARAGKVEHDKHVDRRAMVLTGRTSAERIEMLSVLADRLSDESHLRFAVAEALTELNAIAQSEENERTYAEDLVAAGLALEGEHAGRRLSEDDLEMAAMMAVAEVHSERVERVYLEGAAELLDILKSEGVQEARYAIDEDEAREAPSIERAAERALEHCMSRGRTR